MWNFHILQNFWKLRYKEQLGNTNKVSYTLIIKMEMEGYSQDKVLDCDSKEHDFLLIMHWWKKTLVILSVDQNESSIRLRIYLLVCISASEKRTHLEGILQIGYLIFHYTF